MAVRLAAALYALLVLQVARAAVGTAQGAAVQANCAPPAAVLNATGLAASDIRPEELRFLEEEICWPTDGRGGAAPLADVLARHPSSLGDSSPRGVPPGVSCTVQQWCNDDVCTDICAPGSVALPPWLANAVMQQTRLVQALPLCFATLLGTHNSAITLANGYGNLDLHFQDFLKYIK